ncbi:MAG: hypothetical protein ABIT08_02835 [Bacteroidia bacterium]
MKKKGLLTLCACMLLASAYAQPFKQVGGENNLQLLFTPWGNSPISLNNGIYYRKFNATGTSAWRIGFSIASTSSTDVLVQAADTFPTAPTSNYPLEIDKGFYSITTGINPQADEVHKTFSFSIRPGYEMHLTGTDRLSPYWGAELVFSKSSDKRETDDISEGNYTAVYYDTTTVNPIVSAPYTVYTLNQKGGSTTFGINLIAGFDFYFTKNLSLGGELNFGYSTTNYSDLETEYVKPTTTEVSNLNPTTFITTTTVTNTNTVTSAPDQKQGSSNGFGPNVIGQIKLGWLF